MSLRLDSQRKSIHDRVAREKAEEEGGGSEEEEAGAEERGGERNSFSCTDFKVNLSLLLQV
jgi:hypothetical protein